MALLLISIVLILIVSLFIGGPVATSMGFTTVIIILFFWNPAQVLSLSGTFLDQCVNSNNIIVPMFILMAEFMSRGGIAEDLYYVISKYLHKLKGGLAMATVLACTIFAALCGSSPATAATIGRVSLEEMTKRGYKPDYAVGTVAGGGTLGIMIPPSITLVMYGFITQTSITKLLMAGILPGLMLSALMVISVWLRAKISPSLIGELSKKERLAREAAIARGENVEKLNDYEGNYTTNFLQDIKKIGPSIALIIIVFAAMYTGMATASESAGFGALGAFFIVLARRRMNKKVFVDSAYAAARTTGMMILMLAAGMCLSNVIGRMGIATELTNIILASGVGKWTLMILLYVLWYFLGCVMSPTAMVVLTVPFLFPVLTSLGFDPIWIGIVSTLCVEVGMITPPVGNNLFVLKMITKLDMGIIIKGAIPYVIVLTIGLIILSIFPQIATFIPSMM